MLVESVAGVRSVELEEVVSAEEMVEALAPAPEVAAEVAGVEVQVGAVAAE